MMAWNEQAMMMTVTALHPLPDPMTLFASAINSLSERLADLEKRIEDLETRAEQNDGEAPRGPSRLRP